MWFKQVSVVMHSGSRGGSGCRMRMWTDGAQGSGGSACDLAFCLLPCSGAATLLRAAALSSGNLSSLA
ncbi:hypothetical protein CesoFtcFv8_007575 [Champsocephalus esox]|uniref:Uncharacterized protein n=1 Tax=Champsocephalus esox TaxID=159716 RepID=A0AAN8CJ10_9TELE|nr:hypothetical protein CesoFtcFv8_007575 [Champsocephalus esox]